MNNTQALIGKPVVGAGFRDAIHVSVIPLEARVSMQPGTHCGLDRDGKADPDMEPKLMIVDPFLKEAVATGERCWCFLYPNTITDLRHEWTHPAFQTLGFKDVTEDGDAFVRMAETYLREMADRSNLTYEGLLRACEKYLRTGKQIADYDSNDIEDTEVFWRNYELVAGVHVSEDNKQDSIFTCC